MKRKILYGILSFVFGLLFGGILSFCSADGIYHNNSLGLISVVYGDSGFTISDKNLGATCTDVNNTCSYGDYFQWGNIHGFSYSDYSQGNIQVTNDLIDGSLYSYSNPLNNSYYIIGQQNMYSTFNEDLWGSITNTNISRQGPCPEGFHVPSQFDFSSFLSLSNSLSITSDDAFGTYYKFPKQGNLGYQSLSLLNRNSATTLLTSDYYSSNNGNIYSVIFYLNGSPFLSANLNSFGIPIRCFKNDFVSPTSSWTVLLGDSIQAVPEITVYYNDGDSTIITCNGDNSITINGLSTLNNSVFTPYFNISYTDEDNQNLTESYSKNNLFLVGQFKKTYTGDNDWILTAQGSESIFTGYLPTFDITGGIAEVSESGNIFNNFAENSIKFTLSNIPSYIQYVIILFILFFILGFIRKFRRK